MELGQQQPADFGCNLGVRAGEHEPSLSTLRLMGGNGGGEAEGRCGINLLASPSSGGLERCHWSQKDGQAFSERWESGLGKDPYIRTPNIWRHSGGLQKLG